MIPNVFISSTIYDLHHLRDAVRDAIRDLELIPIMSEHGEIGYLHNASAEDSCYITMRQCQLAVVLIGKRYGELNSDGISITHKEFRTAKSQAIPVITLVDSDVMTYKAIYDANKDKDSLHFPGMDRPISSFNFIKEISSSAVNNGIQTYKTTTDARTHIKRQIAHILGELLRSPNGNIAPDVKDILAEIKTIRAELNSTGNQDFSPFLTIMKHLINLKSSVIKSITEAMYSDPADAVPVIMKSDSAQDYVKNSGYQLMVMKSPSFNDITQNKELTHFGGVNLSPHFEELGLYTTTVDNILSMDENTFVALDTEYAEIKTQAILSRNKSKTVQ